MSFAPETPDDSGRHDLETTVDAALNAWDDLVDTLPADARKDATTLLAVRLYALAETMEEGR